MMRLSILVVALALGGCSLTPAQECALDYSLARDNANDAAANGELFTGQDEYNAAQVKYGNCMASVNQQAQAQAQKPSQMPTWP